MKKKKKQKTKMGNHLAIYLLVTKNQNIASGYKFFFILMTNDVTHE